MSKGTYINMATGCSFDAKVLAAGNAAFGAVTRMAAWCGQHLTDGIIPVHVARAIGTEEEIERALRAGLLSQIDDGNLELPAYLKWNRSKEQVEEAKEKTRRRKARSRDKCSKQGNVTRDNSVTARVTDGGVTLPDPDPDPDPDPPQVEGRAGAREATPHHPHRATERYELADPKVRAIADAIAEHPNIVGAIHGEVMHLAEASFAAIPKHDARIGPDDFAQSVRDAVAELPAQPTERAARNAVRTFVKATRPGSASGCAHGVRGPDDAPAKHPIAKAPKSAARKMTDAEARAARQAWLRSQGGTGPDGDPKDAPDPAGGPALALVPGGLGP